MRRASLRLLLAILALLLPVCAAAQLKVPLGDLEAKLRLTPAQKAQFDAASAATQRALFAIGLAALQMKGTLALELQKDKPDLDALAREQEAAAQLVRPQFEAARVEWAKLYGLLDAEQAAIARQEIDRKLRQLEEIAGGIVRMLREKLLEASP